MKRRIESVKGREIIDSRGAPALEAEVFLENGESARASVPSGASKGRAEAFELRDGDKSRFFGQGLLKALNNLDFLSSKLKGFPADSQEAIDAKLTEWDGTPSKSRLGANTLLAVSLACWKLNGGGLPASAAATSGGGLGEGDEDRPPPDPQAATAGDSRAGDSRAGPASRRTAAQRTAALPVPLMNILNGGLHGSNNLNIQEFMIAPFAFDSFKEALRAGCEIFYCLKNLLKAKNLSVAAGDEGGFSPALSSHEEALSLVAEAVERAGYKERVGLALDCAASEFYQEKTGRYLFEGEERTASDMISLYKKWMKQHPLLISLEDGLAEEDWKGWRRMTEELGDSLQIVGDDLFATNLKRLTKGIEEKAANALLVKCNQAGTVSEARAAVLAAKAAGFACIMSHRSGETEDVVLADLAVAWGCRQIKAGAPCRGERTAKYNRLLRIEETAPRFAAALAFKNGLL